MPESATQTQSDAPADIPTAISEAPLSLEPLPAQEQLSLAERLRANKSTLMLIGGPLAGALLVWLAISVFSSKPAPPPAVVAEQSGTQPAAETPPATEPPPAFEPQTATETPAMGPSAANSADAGTPEANPAGAKPAEAEPAAAELTLAQAAAESGPQPAAPSSAINEVTPTVPQSALNTISGTVRVLVRVTIDDAGAVVDATAADPGPSRYFERLSVNASKKWQFASADSPEPRSMLVKFNFTRDGVTAQAAPDDGR